ncbi:MAG: DUF1326 domain-containing protein [Acidobacteriota bacterium]|nr:DUF1326 domain-containing protein [Acidobacteriota bacterium]MDH3786765.1 DUF1326 domain-containing protein [Acidobacteriota bacterium]
MSDKWMINGMEFGNCNCAQGCPCQFSAPTTHGFCEAVIGGHVIDGYFNDISLDGLDWILLVQWPGEIAAGNGKQQAIIEERATPEQREALRKIVHGESTAPGATHFFVYNSTMSEVLDPLYAPIDLSIDVDARQGHISVAGLVEAKGVPMTNPFSGEPSRARIHLPEGFEYTYAEVGSASCKVTAGINLDLNDSYAQFNLLHMNQDGVIR